MEVAPNSSKLDDRFSVHTMMANCRISFDNFEPVASYTSDSGFARHQADK